MPSCSMYVAKLLMELFTKVAIDVEDLCVDLEKYSKCCSLVRYFVVASNDGASVMRCSRRLMRSLM